MPSDEKTDAPRPSSNLTKFGSVSEPLAASSPRTKNRKSLKRSITQGLSKMQSPRGTRAEGKCQLASTPPVANAERLLQRNRTWDAQRISSSTSTSLKQSGEGVSLPPSAILPHAKGELSQAFVPSTSPSRLARSDNTMPFLTLNDSASFPDNLSSSGGSGRRSERSSSLATQSMSAIEFCRYSSSGEANSTKTRSPTLESVKNILSLPSWSPSTSYLARSSSDEAAPSLGLIRGYFHHLDALKEDEKIERLHSDESHFFEYLEGQKDSVQQRYNCDSKEIDLVANPEYSPYSESSQTVRKSRNEEFLNAELKEISPSRKCVYLEIVNTEKNYIADLKKIVWLRGRIMVSGLLPPSVLHNFIPPVLIEILKLHESIAMHIEKEELSLINAFVIVVEKSSQELYQKYCKIYPKLVKTTEKVMDPSWPHYSQDVANLMQKHSYTTSFVKGVLISPIQRITRYQLLLGEYRKTAAAEGRDNCVKKIEILEEGLKAMIATVDRCS